MRKAGSSTSHRMLLYGHPDSRPLLEAMKKPWVARIPGSGAAMIKQAEKTYAPLEVEKQVQEFWDRARVYRRPVAAREKGEDFCFGDGPPCTTGSIHLGQVLNKTIKDLVVRYHRMRGYHVRDEPGYDMHGLPIEVQVEKTLGITNKKEIEELGIEKFVNTCRTFASDLLKKMTAQFQSLGIWLDWDRPYMTIRNEFIEAAWWTLKHAHEREWIYEALRSIQWWSRCETKKGSDLVGLAYLHPLRTKLPYQKGVKGEWVHKVVSSETVVAEYTGLVHSAPGHGPEDFELGQKLGMPAFSPVDARGHFTDDAGTYAGQSVREANPRIVADLGTAHALFTEETIVHAYGHCWRCKTPILFRATVQWFLKGREFQPERAQEGDVGVDSGVSSWASLGYPAREDEFRRWWPQDWIVEGPDQTRRWFSSQLAAGVVAFDRAPYDQVLMHGWVNGPDRRQMHKSLGNYIEPETVISKFGVDPLRFYVIAVNAPWDDITFQEEGVRNAHRTLNILWNVLRFATTYMVLDRFDPLAADLASVDGHLRPEDRWLLSRLEGLKKTVNAEMTTYNLHRAARAVESFILDDLSRWYVKLVRGRTWTETDDRDKLAAYHVLFEALSTLALLLAPLTPHIAEAIYQRLDGRKLSVHMLDWPAVREPRLRPELERSMAIVQELVEVVSKERQKGGRKLRWPLKMIAVRTATRDAAEALATLRSIFLDQVNAKDLAILRSTDDFPGPHVVANPDPAAIGKTYKALAPKIIKLLAARPPEEIRKALERGPYALQVDGQTFSIEPEMVHLEKGLPADVARVETPHGEVYLDLRVTPELQAEAHARELIRRIQQMRKDLDLDVDDFIAAVINTDKEFAASLESQKAFIARETRSRSLAFTDKPVESEHVVEWKDVDGHAVTIGVTPLHLSEAIREFTRIPGITVQKAMALFDAGYKSLATLRAATKQELAAVDGLTPGDIDRIFEFLASPEKVESVCRICQASVPSGMRRCPRCGEARTSEAIPCPRCSSAIPPGAEACPVCGFALSVQTPPGTPSRAPCVACGELIPVGSSECPSCGAPQVLRTAAASSVSAGDAPPPLLKDSSSYLVREATPEEAYRLFLIAQKAGKKGLVITRLFPQKVRERFGLSALPILWLSNVGKESTIRPKDLQKLSLAAEQFLSRESGVVLLDAVEYLVTNNNFLTVLRLVQSIRDQVAVSNGVFLLSVNPSTLDAHQMTLLEREVDRVIDATTGSSAPGSG